MSAITCPGDLLGRDRCPGDLRLSRRDGLENRLDPAGPDNAGFKFEGDLDHLSRLDVAGGVLGNFNTDESVGCVDERHHRRQREICDAGALAQRDVGGVAVGRRADDRLVESPLRALQLSLQLIDFGLSLLNIEATAGIPLEQRCHL